MRKNLVLLLVACLFITAANAQKKDSASRMSYFMGSVSVTNNGLSLIPTFSLGKPASILVLATGKGRFSFEPEMRFALEGKPWSFIFWWRYKLVQKEKFSLRVGAHPALNFRTQEIAMNGVTTKALITRRFLTAELAPNYKVTKKTSVGVYYLFSYGLDDPLVRYRHFFTINSVFSDVRLSHNYAMRFAPQVFYLRIGKEQGYFTTATINFSKKNFPLSVGTILNKRIKADITGSKAFVWNVSLFYSFSKKYFKL
jgi:hypothetical protein